MGNKKRLDLIITERGLAPSRTKAQAMIMAGEVLINNQIADKPGMKIDDEDNVQVKSKPKYVSRGGEKLAGALADFSYNPQGKICADVGACTGGFTDCLLQNGAKRVYAIDVGYGQLDYSIRIDERVVVMERTNARFIDSLHDTIDLAVVDASFISLRILLPAIQKWLSDKADIIALIKPQFEAGKEDVGKGGIVRDKQTHARVLNEILTFGESIGLKVKDLTISPIKGSTGNTEFLVWFSNYSAIETRKTTDQLIETVLANIE